MRLTVHAITWLTTQPTLFPYTTLFRSQRSENLNHLTIQLHGNDALPVVIERRDGGRFVRHRALEGHGRPRREAHQKVQIGRAHVWTPVTDVSRMPSSA